MSTATDTTVTVAFDPTAINKQADVIFPVNRNTAGVMTPEMLAELTASVALDDVAIFVNPLTGSDANPGTQDLPLKTFIAGMSKVPAAWAKSCSVNLSAGDYDLGLNINYGIPNYFGPTGTPLVIRGTPLDQLGVQTSLGGSTSTSYVSAVTTVNGALRGAYLLNQVTGGRALITDNTFGAGNTTFTLLGTGAFLGSVGDTFVVERPGSILKVPEFGVTGFGLVGSFMGLKDVKIVTDIEPPFALPLAVFVGFITCEAVEIDGGTAGRGLIVIHGSRMTFASHPESWFNQPNNPFSNDRAMAGLYQHTTSPFGSLCLTTERSSFEANAVLDGVFFDVSQTSNADLVNVNSVGSCAFCEIGGELFIDAGSMSGSLSGLPGTVVFSPGKGLLGFGNGLDISGGLADAVNLSALSQVQLGNVTGTGNTGYGVSAQNMSQAITNEFGPGSTTVTGASGDTLVGATPKTYGALPFTDSDTLNRIQ